VCLATLQEIVEGKKDCPGSAQQVGQICRCSAPCVRKLHANFAPRIKMKNPEDQTIRKLGGSCFGKGH
jgi:hypothetical protein